MAVEQTEHEGFALRLAGADLMDGTPVYDVKPYVPYADCHPQALSGFAADSGRTLNVRFSADTLEKVPENKRAALSGVLANDPRPRYQRDPERVYAMEFAGLEVKFSVDGEELIVKEIEKDEEMNSISVHVFVFCRYFSILFNEFSKMPVYSSVPLFNHLYMCDS